MPLITKIFLVTLVLGSAGVAIVPLFQQAPAKSRNVLPNESPARLRMEKSIRLQEQAYDAWHREHNYVKAEQLFRESDAAYGEDSDVSLSAFAEMAAEQGNKKKSWEYYTQLFKMTESPTIKSSNTMFHYGMLSQELGKSVTAREAFLKTLRITPLESVPDEYQAQCKALLMQKADSASVAQLQQLATLARLARDNKLDGMKSMLSAAPNRADIQLLLGLSLHRFGRYDEAKTVLQKASRTSDGAVRQIASDSLVQTKD